MFIVSLFQVVTIECTVFENLIPLIVFMIGNMLVSVMKGFAYNMLEMFDCFPVISLAFATHPEDRIVIRIQQSPGKSSG